MRDKKIEKWQMAEYLRKDNLGEGKREKEVRTLFKLRCRNLQEGNKYW